MMTKKERMEKLNNAGINTSKYFTVDLDNGTKIHLIIDENGQPKVVGNKPDAIAEQIITDGYVRNTKLHRRFVMAQMFNMLNYESWDGYEEGFNACLKNRYGYQYTFDMMLDEVKVLNKLEVRDKESFDERVHFFTKQVVAAVLIDYVENLKKYVEKLPTKKCKGVPYKRIKGNNIFVEDLNKKLYGPMMNNIADIKYAQNYSYVYRALKKFMGNMIKLPYNTPKSKVWIDAYKGEGAYYTLKNLVMFHGCKIESDMRNHVSGAYNAEDAMRVLKQKLDEYYGDGYRMFALMKKVIKDNGINTNTYIAEVCKK